MSETAVDAETTATAPLVPDGNEREPNQSAESAPAATRPGEEETDLPSKVRSRFDELTRRRYDAEQRADQIARDRDEWRDRALKVERPEPVEASPVAAGKTLADFGYDESKYQAHLFQQAESRAVKAAQEQIARQQETTSAAQREAEFVEREQEFAKDLPDYFEVTRRFPCTKELADAITALPEGPALAYNLGKNPAVAAKIARLPPLIGAMELGKIAAKLSEKPKAPQVSAAPPPAPKIAAGESKVDKEPTEMTPAEFAKWRRKFMK